MRQWFRILARRPSLRLSMPSASVDEMWHEFLVHTRHYAAFCDAAFGQFLHHEPESAMSPELAVANQGDRLLLTLRLARRDEGCGPHALPLLFRVDEELGITDGRRYLLDCGGREHCHDAAQPGLTCLHHLNAPPVPLWVLRRRPSPFHPPRPWGGGHGGGGGCGGGGGG